MKVTKIVTRATMYDTESGEQYTKMYIGRLKRRKVENISGDVCLSVESVKARISIPDDVIEEYAEIEIINDGVKAAELN